MSRKVLLLYGIACILHSNYSSAQNTPWATSGNIGIGTTSPNASLQVGNPGNASGWQSALFESGIGVAPYGSRKHTFLYAGAGTDYFGIAAYDYQNGYYLPVTLGWGGANVYLAREGGNVGIGITNPQQPLDVHGWLRVQGNGSSNRDNSGGIDFFTYVTPSSNIQAQIRGLRGMSDWKAGQLAFYTAAPGTGTLNENMTITENGNVGIGTTIPYQKLEVIGGSVAVRSAAVGTDSYIAINPMSSLIATGRNGTGILQALKFGVADQENMRIDLSGNVGIGTTSPNGILEAYRSSNSDVGAYVTNVNAGTSAFTTMYVSNDGTGARAAALGFVGANNTTGGAFQPDAAVLTAGTSLSGGLSIQTRTASPIRFYTNGHTNERMRVDENGNIGIGTTSPSEKLAVNGNIRARKVIVSQNSWSDYVFSENYKLRSLSEVAQFIKDNKHLPEIPTAKEVQEKGISVGDNQALLLKKIEELTLYLIEQQKRIDQQARQIETLMLKLNSK